jgi:ubiquinone/menaquinone biosynthesis C-methylase UbiE
VVGEATRLPFARAFFDVALARSVLMYVADRPRAARELWRILRPGGRVSVYEPVHSHGRRLDWYKDWQETLDLAPFEPAHSRIVAHLRKEPGPDWAEQYRGPGWSVVSDFDERDLLRPFVDAGFQEVELRFRHRSAAVTEVSIPARYAEAARAILGHKAAAHLAQLQRTPFRLEPRNAFAEAYLTARR